MMYALAVKTRFCLALPLFWTTSVVAAAYADNLMTNPSAEQAAADGSPAGWSWYQGSGKAKLSTSTAESRSGKSSACLELSQWYVPKGTEDARENHSISVAMVLADNQGYTAAGAIPCQGDTLYTFSFWYKGDVKSAKVSATGWPSPQAGSDDRSAIVVSGGLMNVGTDWRRATGSFRTEPNQRCFALMINAVGKEKEGYTLGKLFVDDVEIMPKTYPDGQLRAVWCGWVKAADREQGLREIDKSLDRLKAAGFNTLFVFVPSLYIAALDNSELQQKEPRAAWDELGEIIKAAKNRNLQVHIWYSPWIYKEKSRAVELVDHPDWAAVSSQGVADNNGLCFIRPEVRQFELSLIAKLIDRYPDLAGIHIEEPGFNWGAEYCYCDHCREFYRKWFGTDIRDNPEAAKPIISNLAAFMSTDFFARLRQMINEKKPGMWLSANGCGGKNPDWRIGRDWTTWAQRGYIDFYVPQLYATNVETFTRLMLDTKASLASCDLIDGIAVSWSGIYPDRQDPELIKAQIHIAEKLGAKGFVVFHLDHFRDEHFEAVRAAIDDKTGN